MNLKLRPITNRLTQFVLISVFYAELTTRKRYNIIETTLNAKETDKMNSNKNMALFNDPGNIFAIYVGGMFKRKNGMLLHVYARNNEDMDVLNLEGDMESLEYLQGIGIEIENDAFFEKWHYLGLVEEDFCLFNKALRITKEEALKIAIDIFNTLGGNRTVNWAKEKGIEWPDVDGSIELAREIKFSIAYYIYNWLNPVDPWETKPILALLICDSLDEGGMRVVALKRDENAHSDKNLLELQGDFECQAFLAKHGIDLDDMATLQNWKLHKLSGNDICLINKSQQMNKDEGREIGEKVIETFPIDELKKWNEARGIMWKKRSISQFSSAAGAVGNFLCGLQGSNYPNDVQVTSIPILAVWQIHRYFKKTLQEAETRHTYLVKVARYGNPVIEEGIEPESEFSLYLTHDKLEVGKVYRNLVDYRVQVLKIID